jgi:hypothetical protein
MFHIWRKKNFESLNSLLTLNNFILYDSADWKWMRFKSIYCLYEWIFILLGIWFMVRNEHIFFVQATHYTIFYRVLETDWQTKWRRRLIQVHRSQTESSMCNLNETMVENNVNKCHNRRCICHSYEDAIQHLSSSSFVLFISDEFSALIIIAAE